MQKSTSCSVLGRSFHQEWKMCLQCTFPETAHIWGTSNRQRAVLAHPSLSFFSPRRALVEFLSRICLTSCAMKLKTHFALFSFSSLYRLQRKFGRNSQLHMLLNLDVLLFVVLVKLWEKPPPDSCLCFISTTHLASRHTCNGLERW